MGQAGSAQQCGRSHASAVSGCAGAEACRNRREAHFRFVLSAQDDDNGRSLTWVCQRDKPGKTVHDTPNNAMPGLGKRGYNVFERGMSGGVLMASPRESKGSTKTVVPTQIEQKSRRTRNRTRPPPAPKNGPQFAPQVFLDTIGEGTKAL